MIARKPISSPLSVLKTIKPPVMGLVEVRDDTQSLLPMTASPAFQSIWYAWKTTVTLEPVGTQVGEVAGFSVPGPS